VQGRAEHRSFFSLRSWRRVRLATVDVAATACVRNNNNAAAATMEGLTGQALADATAMVRGTRGLPSAAGDLR